MTWQVALNRAASVAMELEEDEDEEGAREEYREQVLFEVCRPTCFTRGGERYTRICRL
jgi:hypothetical protein